MSSKRLFVTVMSLLAVSCMTLTAAETQKPAKKDSSEAAAKTAEKATAPAEKAAAEEKAPRLSIVEPVKDYGTVPKGEKLDAVFMIKNTGNADLQIISAKPGCGCTVADFDKVIKPGETGKVSAHVDTTNFAGPIAKGVTVESNDPNNPTSQLTIHAVVKPYVEVSPAGFVRYNMLQGDAETQTIKVYSEEEEPLQITKIEVPAEGVKATFHKIEKPEELVPNAGRPGQNQYQVDITVGGPDLKVGPLADKVRILTNSKHQPEYPISISGVIRPTMRVEPSGINFGEVTPTENAATRTVLLRSNDLKTPDRLVVTKAESNSPMVKAAVRPTPNKGEYEVTLQIARDAKPGDVNGEVKIFTSDKITPIVTVPFKGTIKPAATPSAAK